MNDESVGKLPRGVKILHDPVRNKGTAFTDEMLLAAAHTLADQVTDADLELGRIYPALSRIREVSALIAREVAAIAYRNGLTDREEPADILADIHAQMFQPLYPHYA